jgi:chaperonin GroES
MKVRPLHDRILVERVEEEEKTKSGIYIPDTAKEKPQKGKIVAVGDGKMNDKGERIKLDVKKGDLVLFQKYGGDEIKLDGKELIIMREEDVLAVIEAGN